MKFAGVYAASFGHTKVTSWKNSFYTDFERRELSAKGIIRAAIEVPTIRVIEASFLVRGKSIPEIEMRLEAIADWLLSAGTAKLFSGHDSNHYYNARCTKVEAPTYSGLSARFVATFTCSDWRKYNAATEQPLQAVEGDLSNFRFNGKHCLEDMGCMFVKDSEPVTGAVKAHKYEISGMNGTLRYNTGRPILEESPLSGTLYFVNLNGGNGQMQEEEISKRRHDVASWLVQAERAPLILDSDASRQYEAEVISATSLARTNWDNGMIKVKFIVQPVCESIKSTSVTEVISTVAGEKQIINLSDLTPNGIGYETPLNVTVLSLGGSPIRDLLLGYNLNGMEKTIHLNHADFCISQGSTLHVNSSTGEVALDGLSAVKAVTKGDFPVLSPTGDNYLSVVADAAAELQVIVSCNVRWI